MQCWVRFLPGMTVFSRPVLQQKHFVSMLISIIHYSFRRKPNHSLHCMGSSTVSTHIDHRCWVPILHPLLLIGSCFRTGRRRRRTTRLRTRSTSSPPRSSSSDRCSSENPGTSKSSSRSSVLTDYRVFVAIRMDRLILSK